MCLIVFLLKAIDLSKENDDPQPLKMDERDDRPPEVRHTLHPRSDCCGAIALGLTGVVVWIRLSCANSLGAWLQRSAKSRRCRDG